MDTMQTVVNGEGTPLKSERVEGALTVEPLRIQLKATPEPLPGSGEGEVKPAALWELTFNQPQPVTIELLEPKVIIYLNGLSTDGAAAS
ncbi:MAG TPA: hypothetical protein VHC97_25485 [Thermoanaerobaculia bacterium]|nr:hypothetical protein [Thermoanaerobaculia bacterium]